MLRTIPESKKSKWKDFLNKVVHSYNCTQHEATGYSPFFLMFGRHPCLAIDLILPRCESADQVTYPEYVKKWRQAMEEAYALASERVGQKAKESKRHYDIKVHCPILSPGDCVLVRNLGERGGLGKLRAYWDDQVHIVTKHLNDDNPVYEVVSESGPKKCWILHRNLLLPCQSLPIDTTPAELRKKIKVHFITTPLLEANNKTYWYSQRKLNIQAVMKKMNLLCQ